MTKFKFKYRIEYRDHFWYVFVVVFSLQTETWFKVFNPVYYRDLNDAADYCIRNYKNLCGN